MWWALAGVFAASFALFGVGSTGSVGLQDIIGQGGGDAPETTAASAGDLAQALAAAKATPDDAAVWVRLGQAHQADGGAKSSAGDAAGSQAAYAEAVKAWQKAKELKADDVEILRGLAGAYTSQGAALQAEISAINERAAAIGQGSSPNSSFFPTGLATPDAIASARDNQISQQISAIQKTAEPLTEQANTAALGAYDTWKLVVAIVDDDPALWFEYGGAALNAQGAVSFTDTAKLEELTDEAIRAYRKFLELAPGDPLADEVQATIDQLEGTPAEDEAGTATDGETTDEAPATTGS